MEARREQQMERDEDISLWCREGKRPNRPERKQMRRQRTKQKKAREFPAVEGRARQEETSGSGVGKKAAVWFTSSPMKCSRCSAVRCYEPVCSYCVLCHWLLVRLAAAASQMLSCLFFITLYMVCFHRLYIFSLLHSSALLPLEVVSTLLPILSSFINIFFSSAVFTKSKGKYLFLWCSLLGSSLKVVISKISVSFSLATVMVISSNCRYIFRPYCFPEIQCHLCDVSQFQ